MESNTPDFGPFDNGPPTIPVTLNDLREGNIDDPFDDFSPDQLGASSSSSNPGLLFYLSDGTTYFFPKSSIFGGDDFSYSYDSEVDENWSIEIAVSGGALDLSTPPIGTSATERYDGDAFAVPVESQSFYRIPVIRTIDEEKLIFRAGGIYRENVMCDIAKGPIVELIKI